MPSSRISPVRQAAATASENSDSEKYLEENTVQRYRDRIWKTLERVGRPDSRFHWDFSSFIADFDGSDRATRLVTELDAWRSAERVFITPDNSTELLRREAMRAGKLLIVTTYGIRRGFLALYPADVPADEVSYAATLDGLDRYARPVTLAELRGGPVLPLMITGGSAVSRNGIRFGKGHGYFDLEWAMLSEIGLTDAQTVVVDVVHDEQFVDDHLDGEPHDVPVDWIVTNLRAIEVPNPGRTPGRVRWDLIPGTEHEFLPPIVELRDVRSAVDAE
ncbi:MAG: 5-formyltetrahydrofolate cyclo-ligase [Microbacterium sp.]|uniref:5-formyltetrahydrofolate cyclo-ligase n=1 Tax=Microbacterium sp. TaxID=51671 RepID=UPI00271FBA5D|nr:5-formyltetrahydrofolate cyclo-ligase [Microbacterium sp.]MDO8382976.1 5-formyltetrahydrofolate cyclo-ligase [Microbacterium sp.]